MRQADFTPKRKLFLIKVVSLVFRKKTITAGGMYFVVQKITKHLVVPVCGMKKMI